jgi:hypothetical protein
VPLTSVEERLFAGLASQPLVLQAPGSAPTGGRLVELTARAGELTPRASDVDTPGRERRRLERDITTGPAAPRPLAVNLRSPYAGTPFAGARHVLLAARSMPPSTAIETLVTVPASTRGCWRTALVSALEVRVVNTLPVTVISVTSATPRP